MKKPFNFDTRGAVSFTLGVGVSLLLMTVIYFRLNFTDAESSNFFFLWSNPRRLTVRSVPCGSPGQYSCSKILRRDSWHLDSGLDWASPEWTKTMAKERAGEREYGEVHRPLTPFGSSAFLFVHFGAYRTGPSSFAVVGLGAKPMHAYWSSHPGFQCSWIQNGSANNKSILSKNSENATATRITQNADGMLRVNGIAKKYTSDDMKFQDNTEYIALVVHCNFDSPMGAGGEGGTLNLVAEQGKERKHLGLKDIEFTAMEERAGAYNASAFEEPFQYEYLFCGAPMFGTINPQRVREWIAYHMRLFGDSSHFIFYDAGGMSDDVWSVLKPWVKLGRVSIINARPGGRYFVYYFSQFMFANDCLLQARTLAKWTFFFDLDEYLHVTSNPHLEESFHTLMAQLYARGRKATAVRLQQRPILGDYCMASKDPPSKELNESDWAIERLVYRRMPPEVLPAQWNHWRDPKSIVQAKYVLVMGVHWPTTVELPQGLGEFDTTTLLEENPNDPTNCVGEKMNYYHYRGTASSTGDLCQQILDRSNTTFEFDSAVYKFDDTMCSMANIVRTFERSAIGPESGA